jgi:hypothetical protein
MEEVQEKIVELLDEAKRDGDYDVVSPYLSRVLVTTRFQQDRLIACPEHVKVIDLLVTALKEGHLLPRSNSKVECVMPHINIIFQGRPPKENKIYIHFIHKINIEEVELGAIITAINKFTTKWVNGCNGGVVTTSIDYWCLVLATDIRFTNIYLYCCSKFQQFGWIKLAWMLLNTTFETYEQSMLEIDRVLREEHGYQGFVYRKDVFINETEYGLNDYVDSLHKKLKIV